MKRYDGLLKKANPYSLFCTVCTTSEGAFQWVMQAPVLLFKDSAVFSTESDK
jgi:hypothetical protein